MISYILTPSIATPVSVANGGTGASAAQASLSALLVPQPTIPQPDPDPVALQTAVNLIITTLQTVGVIN